MITLALLYSCVPRILQHKQGSDATRKGVNNLVCVGKALAPDSPVATYLHQDPLDRVMIVVAADTGGGVAAAAAAGTADAVDVAPAFPDSKYAS